MKALVLLACCAMTASADPLAVGVLVGLPGHGSGLPVRGEHVPGGLTARYELAPWPWAVPAISIGVGTPIAGVGASAWGGLELRREIISRVSLFATPGLRTGFVGPGYYARHSDVFVGYEYNYSGPWTVAPRLPVGAVVTLGKVEAYVEVLVEAPLLPTPQILVGGGIGVRLSL